MSDGLEDVIAAVQGKDVLPPNAALLTFDDGYRDHYDHVFPMLAESGLQETSRIPSAPCAIVTACR